MKKRIRTKITHLDSRVSLEDKDLIEHVAKMKNTTPSNLVRVVMLNYCKKQMEKENEKTKE